MATGSNIIHTAISNGHFNQVRFLIDKGADVNARDSLGRTPLTLCSFITDSRWAVGLSRLLIEYGARISKCDQQGFNALHHACVNQKDELVEVYLSALDCDIHSKCKKGNTSLHYAASLGNRAIVRTLAQLVLKYKQTLNPKNKKGLTPLHQAFKANQLDCGDLLIEYGADEELVDYENKSAQQHRKEAVERLDILAQRTTKKRSSSKLIRKIKEEADSEKPKQDGVEINVAKDYDLRNDPEYVFKMTAVSYFSEKDSKRIMKRPKTAVELRPKFEVWKEEILSLWSHYETKFSDSYRSAAKPAPLILDPRLRHESVVGSPGAFLPMSRRPSKAQNSKSRSGSITYDGPISRRSSVTTKRNGMPPLVRTQSRANFGSSG